MSPCDCGSCRLSRAIREASAAHCSLLEQAESDSMELAYLRDEIRRLADLPWWDRLTIRGDLLQLLDQAPGPLPKITEGATSLLRLDGGSWMGLAACDKHRPVTLPASAPDDLAPVRNLPEYAALNEAVCGADDLNDDEYKALVTLRAQQFVAVVGGTANEATS